MPAGDHTLVLGGVVERRLAAGNKARRSTLGETGMKNRQAEGLSGAATIAGAGPVALGAAPGRFRPGTA